jgi:hypothetical protein
MFIQIVKALGKDEQPDDRLNTVQERGGDGSLNYYRRIRAIRIPQIFLGGKHI